MIENVKSSNQYLYHYTKACTALNDIIGKHTLQFSSYLGTNDPKESKAWEFDLGTNQNLDFEKYNTKELSEWLSAALKGKAKLSCFSKDSEGISGDHMSDIHKRGFSKSRMWAQYANNHTGVCLVFDQKKLTKIIEREYSGDDLVLHGSITYVDRSVIRDLRCSDDQQYTINLDDLEEFGRDAYVRKHLSRYYKRLFFEKVKDWRDESEWRYVVFSQVKENLYLDYEDALVGIMFGNNTDQETAQQIMDATASWKLRYMGLKWRNCSPWYDYENLQYILGN